jgi:hypothetical protein
MARNCLLSKAHRGVTISLGGEHEVDGLATFSKWAPLKLTILSLPPLVLSYRGRSYSKWHANENMRQSRKSPPLPPYHASVVQFKSDTQVEEGHVVGRVEHVVSRQAAHFQSLKALLGFLARVLNEVRQAQARDLSGSC